MSSFCVAAAAAAFLLFTTPSCTGEVVDADTPFYTLLETGTCVTSQPSQLLCQQLADSQSIPLVVVSGPAPGGVPGEAVTTTHELPAGCSVVKDCASVAGCDARGLKDGSVVYHIPADGGVAGNCSTAAACLCPPERCSRVPELLPLGFDYQTHRGSSKQTTPAPEGYTVVKTCSEELSGMRGALLCQFQVTALGFAFEGIIDTSEVQGCYEVRSGAWAYSRTTGVDGCNDPSFARACLCPQAETLTNGLRKQKHYICDAVTDSPTATPKTEAPPTALPLTALPPTALPPTALPPTDVPATDAPTTSTPSTDAPPGEDANVGSIETAVPTAAPMPEEAGEAWTGAAVDGAAGTVLAGVSSVSYPIDGGRTSLLTGGGHCGETPPAGASAKEALPWTLHPLRFEVGGSVWAGAVVGNALLFVGGGILSCGVLFAARRLLKVLPKSVAEGVLDTQGLLRLPSNNIFLFLVLYQGTSLAALRMLVAASQPFYIPVGAAGVLLCIIAPVVVHRKVRDAVPSLARYRLDDRRRRGWVRFLIGGGEWVSMREECWWSLRYTCAMRSYKQRYSWWLSVETAMMFLLSAASSIARSTLGICCGMELAVALLLASGALAMVIVRPHHRPRDNVLSTLIYLAQTLSAALVAVAYCGGGAATTSWMFRVSDASLSTATAMIVLRAVLEIGSEVYVLASGRRDRLQAMEYAEQALKLEDDAREAVRGMALLPLPLAQCDSELAVPAAANGTSTSTVVTSTTSLNDHSKNDAAAPYHVSLAPLVLTPPDTGRSCDSGSDVLCPASPGSPSKRHPLQSDGSCTSVQPVCCFDARTPSAAPSRPPLMASASIASIIVTAVADEADTAPLLPASPSYKTAGSPRAGASPWARGGLSLSFASNRSCSRPGSRSGSAVAAFDATTTVSLLDESNRVLDPTDERFDI
eukprot:Rhum_TRINITY_DN14967_c9_g2::Rhum_TRINITY_DN14967_c9_g2_i1::g.131460::m.131460